MRVNPALLLLAGTALTACSTPSEPAPVTLQMQLVSAVMPAAEIEYRFTVRNDGAATIYLPACNGTVVPTFSIVGPGDIRDRTSYICPANVSSSPVALGPGERHLGSGLLARRPGARFEPSVNYARAVGDLPAFRATAPGFDSP